MSFGAEPSSDWTPGLGASERKAIGVGVNKRYGSRSQFKETPARLSGSLKSHSLNLHIACVYTVRHMFMHTDTQKGRGNHTITQTHTVIHLGVQSAIRCSSFPSCCLTGTRLQFKGPVPRKTMEEEEEEKEKEEDGGRSGRAFFLFHFLQDSKFILCLFTLSRKRNRCCYFKVSLLI